jgi:tetratricopeptide (TPR) repeat protein
LADALYNAGRTAEAQRHYQRCLELAPSDPYARLGLARVAIQRGDWLEARHRLEQAVEEHPSFGNAHRLLGEVHQHFGRIAERDLAIQRANELPRFRPAPDPWRDDLTDLCFHPDQLLVHASRAGAMRDTDRMLRIFERLIALNPSDPQVCVDMARIADSLGDTEPALAYCRRSLEQDPNHLEAHALAGRLLWQLALKPSGKASHLTEATLHFESVLERAPNRAEAHRGLGVCLNELGRPDRALFHLREAVRLSPADHLARHDLGYALQRAGRLDEALEHYRVALSIRPAYNTLYQCAGALQALGCPDEAEERYRQALALQPDSIAALNDLAWLLAARNPDETRNPGEAVRLARKASALAGGRDAAVLDTLASALAAAGDVATARLTAERALALAQQQGASPLAHAILQRLEGYRSLVDGEGDRRRSNAEQAASGSP